MDSPLEVVLALLHEDYSPGEAARLAVRLLPGSIGDIRRLVWGACLLFRAASRLDQIDDLDASLALIGRGKNLLREVALIWLGHRTCQCCLEERQRLEDLKNG